MMKEEQKDILQTNLELEDDSLRSVLIPGLVAYFKFLSRERRTPEEVLQGLIAAGISRLPEHFEEGVRFVENMKRADRVVNEFYSWVIDDTDSEIGRRLGEDMENPKKSDHGFPHVRRVEEWIEAALFNTPDIRHGSEFYRFLLPSLYLACRFHDAFQLISGEKESHAELAELWLLSQVDKIREVFGVSEDDEDAKAEVEKYVRGAAIIIHHHSHPEQLEATGKVAEVSPAELYNKAKSAIELLPEEVKKEFLKVTKHLIDDEQPIIDIFDHESKLVLKRYAEILGTADKADTAFPGGIALTRLFLPRISKERDIFSDDIYKEESEISRELYRIINSDPGDEFESDFEWAIFMLARKPPSAGSFWLDKKYKKNRIVAARESGKIFTSLMEGDMSELESIYERRKVDLYCKAFRRAKVTKAKQKKMLAAETYEDKTGLALQYLVEVNFQINDRLVPFLDRIDQEFSELEKALDGKVHEHSQEEIDYVKRIFELLHELLCSDAYLTPEKGDELESCLPFRGYDTISKISDMNRGKYRPIKKSIIERIVFWREN